MRATSRGERALEGDDHPIGVHRAGRHERSFDDLVGVAAQDAAILERPRLAFCAVDDDRRRARAEGVGRHRLPLAPGREAGAAAAAQPGVEDGFDDLRRVTFGGCLQSDEPTGCAVLAERGDRPRAQHATAAAGFVAIGRTARNLADTGRRWAPWRARGRVRRDGRVHCNSGGGRLQRVRAKRAVARLPKTTRMAGAPGEAEGDPVARCCGRGRRRRCRRASGCAPR